MSSNEQAVKTVMDIAVKLIFLAIILFVSFLILKPFLGIILWSIILAVALFPPVNKLSNKLSTSRRNIVISVAIIANLLLIVPTYMISDKAIDTVSELKVLSEKKELTIPHPNEKVKQWPIIGEKIYNNWENASNNLDNTLKTFAPQIRDYLLKMIKMVGDTLTLILLSMVAIVISGFLILKAENYEKFYKRISKRLIGEKGDEWANLTVLTIRSVANGVIGVAVIQASFALAGLLVMDIPFGILIAIGIMFLTIVQLPALIIVGPLVGFVLSQDTSTSSIVFSIYMLVVGAMDGVLKPLLMGRGVDMPMLVVLIGAIGGMILMGMIGLFIGAVIFSLAYKLFELWLGDGNKEE